MSIRWPVAVTALVVTLLVLFGGYFTFQWSQVDRPLEAAVSETPHIKLLEKEVQPTGIMIRLEADHEFSLTRDFPQLHQRLATIASGRQLSVEVGDHPDPVLVDAWNEMVFGVEEGLAHQRYSHIPKAVNEGSPDGVDSRVAMDETHLYVELKRDDARLFRILPLHKMEGEVKNNE